jgi:hypothetical protein
LGLKVGNHFATNINATKNRVAAKRVSKLKQVLMKQKFVLRENVLQNTQPVTVRLPFASFKNVPF